MRSSTATIDGRRSPRRVADVPEEAPAEVAAEAATSATSAGELTKKAVVLGRTVLLCTQQILETPIYVFYGRNAVFWSATAAGHAARSARTPVVRCKPERGGFMHSREPSLPQESDRDRRETFLAA
jgi:hypothetical protein